MNSSLNKICDDLKAKKIGVFPCDTIWGLIGIMDLEVIQKVFELKKRDQNQPFLILIPNIKTLTTLAEEIPDCAKELIKKYWPGPLTIIFKKNKAIDPKFTAQKDTIAIRYPKFIPLNFLLDKINRPLISTSVNISKHEAISSLKDIPNSILK
ncbi:L-threonylcarbamoyladenylate synthase, partial [Candidatus Margulisiibacteriota bacterium]